MKIPNLLILITLFLITSNSLTLSQAATEATEENLKITNLDNTLQIEAVKKQDNYSDDLKLREELVTRSFTPSLASHYIRSMVINEVGIGLIEIYNNAYYSINITDYHAVLYLSNGSTFTIEINENVVVNYGSYYVLDNSNSNITSSIIDPTGGFLELKSRTWEHQDVVAWGHIGKAPALPDGASISRVKITEYEVGINLEWIVANDWSISLINTFGSENFVNNPLVDESPIKISEVYVDSEEGFIEIVNHGYFQINVEGHRLFLNGTLIHTFPDIILAVNETSSFQFNSLSSIGNLYLYDKLGGRISQMGWDILKTGQSLNRFFDYTFDYSEIDDCFTYDEEQILSFRKIIAANFDWDKTDGYLSIKKMDVQNFSRDYIVQFFEDKNYKVLEKKDIKFKENQGFIISYIDDSGTYNYNIYIAPKNLRFHYEGDKENYEIFKEIIDDIEFLEP